MADRPPEHILKNKDRIARTSVVVDRYVLPARLLHIGAWNGFEYLLHIEWTVDTDLIYDIGKVVKNTAPSIDYIIEWSDHKQPTLFTAGYLVHNVQKEEEMTLIAIYLKPDVAGYQSMYESLVGSKQLLDRSIKIDSIGTEIAHRFANLILE